MNFLPSPLQVAAVVAAHIHLILAPAILIASSKVQAFSRPYENSLHIATCCTDTAAAASASVYECRRTGWHCHLC